ncbi:MAG: polyphosphate polymerase domain-containing protein [Clostridiales bacterium]|nr:polyphosphate polymerase domain-containing protein [Clostridiales bacterium]
MKLVLREEKKYLITLEEYFRKSHFLSQLLMQDPNNGIHGYTVRSLYFDTIYDKDFFEKRAGIELRRKIRLRIYDPSSDHANLEMKQKQGEYQLKRSMKLKRTDAERMVQGYSDVLLKYDEPFAAECYALMNKDCYLPKTVVEYNRKAFIAKENRIRVTFDSRIQSTESSFDLFSNTLNMNPILDPSGVVLEVKYNCFLLSYIKDMVTSVDSSKLSISKYSLARQQGYCTRL